MKTFWNDVAALAGRDFPTAGLNREPPMNTLASDPPDPPIPDQPVIPDSPSPSTPDVPDIGTPEPEPDQLPPGKTGD